MATLKTFKFKLGDKINDVWAGDLVTECEFVAEMGQGRMLFYDTKFKCFRRVYITVDKDGKPYMNGWDCGSKPSDLL